MTSFPAGNRALVTPDATMVASVKIGAPARNAARAAPTSAGWIARSRVRSVCPLACTIRTATFSASGGRCDRSASARIIANDSR